MEKKDIDMVQVETEEKLLLFKSFVPHRVTFVDIILKLPLLY